MPTFDGDNLLITLDTPAGDEATVDVQDDLYSEWKEWVLTSPANQGYPPAFRTIGGDELSSIINAGAYYFLRNDFGWRIKPAEKDATYYFLGNLAVQDTEKAAFVPTDGAFTSAIVGLQPVTQGITNVFAEQLRYASYAEGVTIDLTSTYTRDNDPDAGTRAKPVNNIADALLIASENGLNRLYCKSNLAFTTEDLTNLEVIGQGTAVTTLTFANTVTMSGTSISSATVSGYLYNCLLERTIVVNPTISNGARIGYDSFLIGTVTITGLSTGSPVSFYRVGTLQDAMGNWPIIDWGSTLGPHMTSAEMAGIYEIRGVTTNQIVNLISGQAARFTFHSSVDGGIFTVAGNGSIVENQTSIQSLTKTEFLEASVAQNTLSASIFAKFDGFVWVDEVNGDTAANIGDEAGTRGFPVDNFTDAVSIAQANGLRDIRIIGSATVTISLAGLNVRGDSPTAASVTISGGGSVTNSEFDNITVSGDVGGAVHFHGCRLMNVTNLSAEDIDRCEFQENIALAGSNTIIAKACYSRVENIAMPPIIDCGGAGPNLYLEFTGAVVITNVTGSQEVAILGKTARFILSPTINGGNWTYGGIGNVINNSTAQTSISGDIIHSVEMKEMYTRLGLNVDNPFTDTPTQMSDANGTITIDVSGDGVTSTTQTRQ